MKSMIQHSVKDRIKEALMPVQYRMHVCPWLGVLHCLLGPVPDKQVCSMLKYAAAHSKTC